jgi:hypothetical protein
MKLSLGCILFLTLTAAFANGQSDSTEQPFTLRISVEKPTIKADSDLSIKVEQTNTSNGPIECTAAYVGGVDLKFYLDVRDEKGLSMRRLDRHPELMPGSIETCTLQPGESLTRDTNVSWLFYLSRPGKYVIQVGRGISSNEVDGMVKSNKLTVTVQ